MRGQGRAENRLSQELTTLRQRIAELEALNAGRERAEKELRRSEATARALLESAAEGIVIVGSDGRIVLANARAAEMFGYPHEELTGQTIEVLLPERLRTGHATHRGGYFGEPRVRPMGIGLDLAGRRKDGTEFPVEISLSFVESEDGLLAMAFITDVTARVQLERIARQSEKMAAVGSLAAGIAHEINNPIGVITSRVELILMEAREKGLPPGVTRDLQVIEKHAGRVAKITQGLLSFSRQAPWKLTDMDVNQVVEEALLLVEKQFTKERIALEKNLAAGLPKIAGSPNHLEQVLVNLLTNAREAMVGGGTVLVESRRAHEMIEIRVTDTGPGIPPEVMARIFDPFFTTKDEGTGLGLSISYGIVREHGGTITIESRPGGGSTFVIQLPIRGTSTEEGTLYGERADPRHR
jgi:PAS domain S-box-containing protein